MAKASYINVPDELRGRFNKVFQMRDRYALGVVQSARRELSDRKKKELSRKAIINSPMQGRGSLFKYLAPMWWQLTQEQKDVWKQAASFSNLSNWQLFISDNAARIRHSLNLTVPPIDLWQVRTGYIYIVAPADGILLSQNHENTYTVARRVKGQPWKEEPIQLTENFSLPLKLEIRYKSNLINQGGTGKARFYAVVISSYQGKDIENVVECVLSLQTDWALVFAQLDHVKGYIVRYKLYLELLYCTGTFMFDNLRGIHSGQNWVRDPRCDNISRTFSRGLGEVAPFWIPEYLPEGTTFSSLYPPSLN